MIIAKPMPSDTCTSTGASTFGAMCRKRMRGVAAPMASAART